MSERTGHCGRSYGMGDEDRATASLICCGSVGDWAAASPIRKSAAAFGLSNRLIGCFDRGDTPAALVMFSLAERRVSGFEGRQGRRHVRLIIAGARGRWGACSHPHKCDGGKDDNRSKWDKLPGL